jgi:hypothetical protein
MIEPTKEPADNDADTTDLDEARTPPPQSPDPAVGDPDRQRRNDRQAAQREAESHEG